MGVIDRSADQFLLDSYTGLGGYLSGAYLVRHERETDAKFLERQQFAEYPNYVRKIVDVYSGFLFEQTPNRETDDVFAAFAADVDGAGTGLDMYMLSAQRLAMLLGTVYLIVDKPAAGNLTRATERLPYLALRLPSALVRSTQDSAGRWTSVTLSETSGGQTLYRTFTRETWALARNADGSEIIEQGEHTLGEVPVVRLHSTLPVLATDERATPWAHDIAQANWSLYNQCSEMRELFRKQTFSLLTIPIADPDEAQRLGGLTISTDNALTYNPAGGGAPAYIAPPDSPVRAYMDSIAATVVRMYQASNLEFVGGVASSGVERKYQFIQTNRALVVMAMLLEQAEHEIADLVAKWQGREFAGLITYPRDFDLADLQTELAEALDSQGLGISPAFDAEVKKRIARRMLGHNVTQATLEIIDAEIEGGADPYGDRARREAGALPPLGGAT